jgi:hypothetical protein
MQPYPKDIDETNLVESLRQISRLRDQDITDRNNFNSIFIMGRKVNKVPTSSTDVASTDNQGDFNFSDSYSYFFTGTEWRRSVLSSW